MYTNGNAIVAVYDVIGLNGKPIMARLEFKSLNDDSGNAIYEANFTTSMYGRNSTYQYEQAFIDRDSKIFGKGKEGIPVLATLAARYNPLN